MNALEKLREISEALSSFGIESPEKEAELIIRRGLDIDLAGLYRDNPVPDAGQIKAIEEMVRRRTLREPLQYILGSTDFMGLRIHVGKGVLIPRPETELLAEEAITTITNYQLSIIKKDKKSLPEGRSSSLLFLDLCTGSGCLALALAGAFPEARVCGIDISDAAINYSRKNAGTNHISNVEFIKGHLFEPLGNDRSFDLIVSNPPYIKSGEIKDLQPEIRDWEPSGALDGGQDGLRFYREIVPAARKFLRDNGILMLELGSGCSAGVVQMMEKYGYSGIQVKRDYAGIERIVRGEWIN